MKGNVQKKLIILISKWKKFNCNTDQENANKVTFYT